MRIYDLQANANWWNIDIQRAAKQKEECRGTWYKCIYIYFINDYDITLQSEGSCKIKFLC